MEKREWKACLIEGIFFFTYVFFSVNWIAGNVLTKEIIEHFQLVSFATATHISNAITLAKIVGNALAAWLLLKYFAKKAIALASFCIALGCGLALISPNYPLFIFSRFLMGLGGAMFLVYFSPMLLHYFDAKSRPVVNAINATACNLGAIFAIFLTPLFSRWGSWKVSMAIFSFFSALLFVFWLVWGEDFPLEAREGKERMCFRSALKEKLNWLFPLGYFGVLLLYLVLVSIYPISGISRFSGRMLSSLIALGGILGSFLCMGMYRVYPRRLPFLRASALAMTGTAALLFHLQQSPWLSIFLAILLGIFLSFTIVTVILIPQELEGMTAAKLTLMMGMFWTLAYFLESLAYFFLGLLIDHYGYWLALHTSLLLSLSIFLLSFFWPETGKKNKSAV